MVARHAGAVLGGLLAAGVLAAVMSSLDSQFLCLGTMFSRDIVLRSRGSRPVDEAAAAWGSLFWHSGFGTVKGYAFPAAGAAGFEGWLAAVVPSLPPVVILLAVSTAVLVGVSLVTRPPPATTLRRFFPG